MSPTHLEEHTVVNHGKVGVQQTCRHDTVPASAWLMLLIYRQNVIRTKLLTMPDMVVQIGPKSFILLLLFAVHEKKKI